MCSHQVLNWLLPCSQGVLNVFPQVPNVFINMFSILHHFVPYTFGLSSWNFSLGGANIEISMFLCFGVNIFLYWGVFKSLIQVFFGFEVWTWGVESVFLTWSGCGDSFSSFGQNPDWQVNNLWTWKVSYPIFSRLEKPTQPCSWLSLLK